MIQLKWLDEHIFIYKDVRWLKILPVSNAFQRTEMEAGALTVAGQWRSFTAFPSILAIAVVS